MVILHLHRKTDNCYVAIIPHKNTGKYSFVNIDSNHICPCEFDTIEDAIRELESRPEVISYDVVFSPKKTISYAIEYKTEVPCWYSNAEIGELISQKAKLEDGQHEYAWTDERESIIDFFKEFAEPEE